MKQIILILGPNGVGKSTTSEILLSKLSKCAYVDAEWCRAINPFQFTKNTRKAVIDNIYSILKNYLLCEDIESIIFPYGLHGERKNIFNEVIQRLENEKIDFELFSVILKCSKEENIKRSITDKRDEERIQRGLENTFHFYDDFDYPAINSTNLTADEVAEHILKMIHTC